MSKSQHIITIEEHYLDLRISSQFAPLDAIKGQHILSRLFDLNELRIKEMDDAGIDMQVLSHANPAVQKLDAEQGLRLARETNHLLHEVIRANPDRFAGFATLPTADPKYAADELERTISVLGFKGAMVHGLANGEFLDGKRYWPIFERAAALDVPLYFHPSQPHPSVVDAYYRDYANEFPWLIRAAWGYGVETATHAIRLILSGVFDSYPNLKIILGHLGEGLPFHVWRIDNALSRENVPPQEAPLGGWTMDGALSRKGARGMSFRDYLHKHFYVTTSGFFSDNALACTVAELGIDRVLFSVDYPFESNLTATTWFDSVPMTEIDRAKVYSGNARQLLKL